MAAPPARDRYPPLAQITPANCRQAQAGLAHPYRRPAVLRDDPEDLWRGEHAAQGGRQPVHLHAKEHRCSRSTRRPAWRRWRYDPKVPDEAIPYTAACRGVSLLTRCPTRRRTRPARDADDRGHARRAARSRLDASERQALRRFRHQRPGRRRAGHGRRFRPAIVSITSPPTHRARRASSPATRCWTGRIAERPRG